MGGGERRRTYSARGRLFIQASWRETAPLSNMEAPMRIVLFLLTATAAAASGAALAQSGTMAAGHSGRTHASTASWKPSPAFAGGHDFRRGPDRDRGRHDRRRHGRFGRGADRFVAPIGGIGHIDEFEAIDPHGNGFFAGGGGEVRLRGGRPYYDYDRSYPYEWASAAAGGDLRWEAAGPLDVERCTTEHGVRVCRGGR